MAIRLLFEGTVAKHAESPEENEDAFGVDIERGRIVLSDGASESFDARNWAQLLVTRVRVRELSWDAVAECTREYEALHDPVTLSWSKAASYERGSFATILIAQDQRDRNTVQIEAMGDCLALWIDGGALLASAPYSRSEQFHDKPTLLASRNDLNDSAAGEDAWTRVEWTYGAQGPRVLACMTDALGAWLLAHQEQGEGRALEQLLAIRELAELQKLVDEERRAGRLRRDDTTLIIAEVTHS